MYSPPKESDPRTLERVYQEASQWVRLVNTIIWSMGTLLVPISFGLLGIALNKSADFQFERPGKIVLGISSVFLFGFWVYASRIYKDSVEAARKVLIQIETEWHDDDELRLYERQKQILDKQFVWSLPYGLFPSQVMTLIGLIVLWAVIVWRL